MTLQRLTLQHFRNITQASLTCHPDWNLVIGDNASGKTSLLESIYYLGRGRSFRAKNTAALIQQTQSQCVVSGAIAREDGSHQLGIQRDAQSTLVRIDSETAKSAAQLARFLPVLFFGPDIHKLITEGPAVRRQFIDWGVFHLNDRFISLWQRYQTALKQRNALLRSHRQMPENIGGWHIALEETATDIDIMRDEFVLMLQEAFAQVISILLPDVTVSMRYNRGWPQDQSLIDLLARDWSADQSYGHTRHGPHRAELLLKVDGKPAVERLSQGQRKLAAIALLVAQSYVFGEITSQPLTLLIDDIAAELDSDNVEKTIALFEQLPAQRWLTATNVAAIAMAQAQDHRRWQITQGKLILEDG